MSTPAFDEDKIIYESNFKAISGYVEIPKHTTGTLLGKQETSMMPSGAADREEYPIQTGCIDYFPNAIAEIAKLSKDATAQHHPGEKMHWQRDKSTGHADKIQRHQLERFAKDSDGHYHATKVAWRALAQLQELLELTKDLPPSPASQGKRTWDT